MRIAIVSDIHGNRTAFEAVLADLRGAAPDLIWHGGDLADGGSSPVEIVDRMRDLGWPGVMGNTDEMLHRPQSLTDFAAKQAPQLRGLFDIVEEMAHFAREALGPERLAWLATLPAQQTHESVALVHASPETFWRCPAPEASDPELESAFGMLDRSVVVYGHVHRPFVRATGARTIANSGSVGLPYDRDPRASYLLIDDGVASIRRVEYEIGREIQALAASKLPHAHWVANLIASGAFQMP